MNDKLLKLYIEPTSHCNLSCKMCFRETWIDESYTHMDMSVFYNAISTMPQSVETIFFGGMGEPLFHPDIIEMITAVKSAGKNAELLTNGTLLRGNMITGLLNSGLDKLWISVDSLKPRAHGEHSGHDTNITKNISEFNKARTIAASPIKLGIAFVVMKSNIGDLLYLPDFIRRYKVSDVNISNLIPSDKASWDEVLYGRLLGSDTFCESEDDSRATVKLPYMDWNDNTSQLVLGTLMGATADIKFGDQLLRRNTRYCRFVEEGHCFVRSDGDVSPCMALLHSANTQLYNDTRTVWHKSYGNQSVERLDEIWYSEEYTDFRDRVRNFSFSPCTRCGGCENRLDNITDCFGNTSPTCGGCLWSEGIVSCP